MRIATHVASSAHPPKRPCPAGFVGPLDSFFSLPTVEVEGVLVAMEGSSTGATRRGPRRGGVPASPNFGSTQSPTQHEVLQNYFKSLWNSKDRGEPWNLGGEYGCYSCSNWEAGNDRVKYVEW